MNRRSFLAAGTLGSASLVGGAGLLAWRRRSDTTPSVSVSGDPVAAERDVEIDLDVRQDFTAEYPARIQFELTYHGDQPEEFFFGPQPPFSAFSSAPDGSLALLPDGVELGVPEGETVPAGLPPAAPDVEADYNALVPPESDDGCWRLPTPFFTAESATYVELEPGEQLDAAYTLLAAGDGIECFSARSYRFEQQNYLVEGSAWGFDVELD